MLVSLVEFVSTIPALSNTDKRADIEGIVGQILFRVSTLFESQTNAPKGYYEQIVTEDTIFTEKTYFGNGTDFLHVHHFVELDDVTLNTSSQLERLIIKDNQTLQIGFLNRSAYTPVTVSAKWGWTEIPEDVKEAVIAQAKLKFSYTPIGRAGFENVTVGDNEAEHLKDTWEYVVDKYRHLNKFAYA